MLIRRKLAGEQGSVVVIAVFVLAIIIPLGLALLAIVDNQTRESGVERSRDRAFNLADSALHSAAFSLGRGGWPASAGSAPSNTGATGTMMDCGLASYGATLGAPTNTGSATARLQPNLNASYDDAAYTGATWQINVCDNDTAGPGPTIWRESLLTSSKNFDQNGDELVWVRSEAAVAGKRRVLAALVRVEETPAFSSKYGLITGSMNAEVSNSLGTLLSGSVLDGVTSALLGTDPLVAPDPTADTTPPTSGVTAVRCGLLEGCLAGTIGGLSSSVAPLSTLIGGGKLVQTTSPTATSVATIGQLKQQAINSGTYVASTSGHASPSSAPACTIPAAANADTVVYIDEVGTTSTSHTIGGPGDQYCVLDVSVAKAYKALVINSGRVVLRGNDTTTNTATVNNFRGLLYALNTQREWLGDASPTVREVIRIEQGARVIGGVAADGKSAQVSIIPPVVDCGLLGVNCALSNLLSSTLDILNPYNPAITSNVSVMQAVKSYGSAGVVPGTYDDVVGDVAS